jgi:hypothetical protein
MEIVPRQQTNAIATCSEVAPHLLSRRIIAIDFFPNVEYVLLITDNPLGKAEGEEAWKTLKAPLQAHS